MTMDCSDNNNRPTAVTPTVKPSNRDEELSIVRSVVTKWLNKRRRNSGQSKRSFAVYNGVTWGVFNKYTASDPNKRRQLEHIEMKKKCKYNDGKPAHHCCISNCDGNDKNATLRSVPDPPPELPAGASKQSQQTFHIKRFISRECRDLMGRGRACGVKSLRACAKHWVTVTGKHTSINICQRDGSTVKMNIAIPPFEAPKRVGDNSINAPPVSLSKGIAYDRGLIREVGRQSMEKPLALPFIQYTAMEDVRHGKLKLSDINPSVLVVAGLEVHIGTNDDVDNDDDENDVDETNREPALTLDNLTDDEVQ